MSGDPGSTGPSAGNKRSLKELGASYLSAKGNFSGASSEIVPEHTHVPQKIRKMQKALESSEYIEAEASRGRGHASVGVPRHELEDKHGREDDHGCVDKHGYEDHQHGHAIKFEHGNWVPPDIEKEEEIGGSLRGLRLLLVPLRQLCQYSLMLSVPAPVNVPMCIHALNSHSRHIPTLVPGLVVLPNADPCSQIQSPDEEIATSRAAASATTKTATKNDKGGPWPKMIPQPYSLLPCHLPPHRLTMHIENREFVDNKQQRSSNRSIIPGQSTKWLQSL
ncbi:hypothetical protein BS47DRAFT_1401796 [Hydnum rufescens UP504]|uniref:Uncharacterized protein n=1 Tax=Hydnum rufescens UP504 TaxID=1448309 RepID=A0A9P6AE71_9AGAM|nr:hypothetical protein BS47DRAFT_1401796 [Hydnum rufescens UP504]